MNIKTEAFKKMAKIILATMERGDRYSESLYLDFSTGLAYFYNSKYKGKFVFEISGEHSDSIENLFIETATFLAICEAYEEISISDNLEISVGQETFKIPCFIETFDYPIYDHSGTPAVLSNEMKAAILEASEFSGKDSKFEGILIAGDSVVSTDRVKIYEAMFEGISNPSIKFPLYLKSIINSNLAAEINIFCNEGRLTIMAYGVQKADDTSDHKIAFEIVGSEMTNLSVPNMKDPSFIEKYNHSTFFVFKRSDMMGVMKFMEPFVKNVINERIYIEVLSESQLSLEVREDVKAKRIIALSECSSDLVGKGVWIRRSDFERAINTLTGDIMLKLDIEKPAFDLSGETQKHICIVRMTG